MMKKCEKINKKREETRRKPVWVLVSIAFGYPPHSHLWHIPSYDAGKEKILENIRKYKAARMKRYEK